MAKVEVADDAREHAPVVKLCYIQGPSLVRCDREQDHAGMHSWEMMDYIYSLRAQLGKLREAH